MQNIFGKTFAFFLHIYPYAGDDYSQLDSIDLYQILWDIEDAYSQSDIKVSALDKFKNHQGQPFILYHSFAYETNTYSLIAETSAAGNLYQLFLQSSERDFTHQEIGLFKKISFEMAIRDISTQPNVSTRYFDKNTGFSFLPTAGMSPIEGASVSDNITAIEMFSSGFHDLIYKSSNVWDSMSDFDHEYLKKYGISKKEYDTSLFTKEYIASSFDIPTDDIISTSLQNIPIFLFHHISYYDHDGESIPIYNLEAWFVCEGIEYSITYSSPHITDYDIMCFSDVLTSCSFGK